MIVSLQTREIHVAEQSAKGHPVPGIITAGAVYVFHACITIFYEENPSRYIAYINLLVIKPRISFLNSVGSFPNPMQLHTVTLQCLYQFWPADNFKKKRCKRRFGPMHTTINLSGCDNVSL